MGATATAKLRSISSMASTRSRPVRSSLVHRCCSEAANAVIVEAVLQNGFDDTETEGGSIAVPGDDEIVVPVVCFVASASALSSPLPGSSSSLKCKPPFRCNALNQTRHQQRVSVAVLSRPPVQV